MEKIDVQTHLRQQLGFARFHINNAENSESLHAKRAGVLAAILCMEEGVREYCNTVLSFEELRLSYIIRRLVNESPSSVFNNFKQQELEVLASGGDSWLVSLSSLRDSIAIKMPEASSASPAEGVLIASSASKVSHWFDVSISELKDIASAINELIVRHSETDIEY